MTTAGISSRVLIGLCAACTVLGLIGVHTAVAQTGDLEFVGRTPTPGLSDPADVVVAPDGKHAYASSPVDGSVTAFSVDAASGELTALQVASDDDLGFDGLSAVTSLAISPDGTTIYANGTGDGAIGILHRDSASGRLTPGAPMSLRQPDGSYLGPVRDLVASEDGNNVYAAATTCYSQMNACGEGRVISYGRSDTSGSLQLVDVDRGEADADDPIGPRTALSLQLSPDGRSLYVGAPDWWEGADAADTLTVFRRDPASGTLTHAQDLTLPTMQSGAGLVAASPHGDHVWVAGREALVTLEVTGNGLAVSSTYSFPDEYRAEAIDVSPDGETVITGGYIPGKVQVVAFDVGTAGEVTERARLTQAPIDRSSSSSSTGGVGFSPSGEHVYVPARAPENTLLTMESGHLSVTDRDPPQTLSWAADVANAGKDVYATSGNDSSVVVLRRSSPSEPLSVVDVIEGTGPVTGNVVPTLQLSADRRWLYQLAETGDFRTFSRDPATGRATLVDVEAVDPSHGRTWARGFALTPDGRFAYLRRGLGYSRYQRDPGGGFTYEGPAVDEGRSVAIGPEGRSAYLASGESRGRLTHYSLDPESGELSRPRIYDEGVRVPYGALPLPGPIEISAEGRVLDVLNIGSVTTFRRNPTTGELSYVGRMTLPANAQMFDLSVDGLRGFVTDVGSLVSLARNLQTGLLEVTERHRNDVDGVDGLSGAWGVSLDQETRTVEVAGQLDGAVTSFQDSWTPRLQTPGTSIASGPPEGGQTGPRPTFRLESDQAITSYRCSLDGAPVSCSGWEWQPSVTLTPGLHRLEVAAVSLAGDVDPTPVSRSFNVAAGPPETSIDSGPEGLTADNTPEFAVSASQADALIECRLDTASWQPCGPGVVPGRVSEGPHVIEARAVGSSGNLDPTPATRSFTVDSKEPETSIDSGPNGLTANANPEFDMSASEAGATIECRLDAAGWVPCGPKFAPGSLSDGSHTIGARATDPAGNTDSTPATRSITVDTEPPDTSIQSGPEGFTSDANPEFGVSASQASVSFECRLGSAVWRPCTGSFAPGPLGDGPHAVSARAIDLAGNTDATPATRSFIVDTRPPDTSIDSGPQGATTETAPEFAVSASEADASLECRLDAGGWEACGPRFAPTRVSEGSHVLFARATDLAGNTDPTPATRSFSIEGRPAASQPPGAAGPLSPPDPGVLPQPAAVAQCDAARARIRRAENKLRTLRRNDAEPRRIQRAKRRLADARKDAVIACGLLTRPVTDYSS